MSTDLGLHRRRPPPLLAERYVIVRRLGKGGAANVYLAHDLQLRRWRALKVMHPQVAEDPSMRTRFYREARLMASIEHPNVVRVLDVANDVAVPFMVMEYVRGGCVLDWLRAHGAMPPQLAAQVALDVAKGLRGTHAVQVVHRDVKPHNVLVHESGVCKLTDYGIAKMRGETWMDGPEEDALTRVGTAMGTASFMPPEQQHNAAAVDERADLYALGATLYTLLKCKAAKDLYVADPDDEQLKGIPDVLVEVVLKACRYKPEDRYRNADKMIDALQAAIEAMGTIPSETPALALPFDELPRNPPKEVVREHVEELLELVATGAAAAYEPDTLSTEASTMLGVDDYTLTPMVAERAAPEPPPNLAKEAAAPPPEASPEAPAPDASAEETSNFSAVPLLVGAVLACVVLLTGALGVVTVQQAGAIERAEARRVDALGIVLDDLKPTGTLIERLAAKGADAGRLQTAHRLVLDAGDADEKEVQAVALHDLLASQYAAVVTRFGEQPGLKEPMLRIDRSTTSLQQARRDEMAARASLGGTLAVALGLAD